MQPPPPSPASSINVAAVRFMSPPDIEPAIRSLQHNFRLRRSPNFAQTRNYRRKRTRRRKRGKPGSYRGVTPPPIRLGYNHVGYDVRAAAPALAPSRLSPAPREL